MKTIAISGIISDFEWEEESNVSPGTLRQSLKDANGEDILVTINSPGGYIFQGLEMFSLLKNYLGNVETRIVSLAASMGSILALAGDKITAEETAGYMIHNPSVISWGDHRALRKSADDMEKMTDMFHELYEKYTNLDKSEAKKYMDDETYFYGSEVEKLGFEIVGAQENNQELNRATSLIMAKSRLKSVTNKMNNEEMESDFYKAAASVSTLKIPGINKPANKSSSKVFNISQSATGGKNQEESMNLDELKTKHPDLYQAVKSEGITAGIEKGVAQERDRVTAHIELGKASGAIDLALDAVSEGTEMTQTITAKYLAEGLKKKDNSARADDDAAAAAAADGAESQDSIDAEAEKEQKK